MKGSHLECQEEIVFRLATNDVFGVIISQCADAREAGGGRFILTLIYTTHVAARYCEKHDF